MLDAFIAEDGRELLYFQKSKTEKMKLKELAHIVRGKFMGKEILEENKDGDFQYLNVGDINDGNVVFDKMQNLVLTKQMQGRLDELLKYEVKENDLVITCRGSLLKLGRVKTVSKTVLASSNIIFIRCNEKLNPEYLSLYLNSNLGRLFIESIQRGSGQVNINPKDFGNILVPVLSMKEQKQIVKNFKESEDNYQKQLSEINRQFVQQKQKVFKAMIGFEKIA